MEFIGQLKSAATAGYDLAVEAQGVAKSLSSVIRLMQSSLPEEFMQQLAHLRVEASRMDEPLDVIGNLRESSGNRLTDMARGILDIMFDAKELLVGLQPTLCP